MVSITIQTMSDPLFDGLKAKEESISAQIGHDIVFERGKNAPSSILINGAAFLLQTPVRLGIVIDTLRKNLVGGGRGKEVILGAYLLRPRDLILEQGSQIVEITEKELDILLCVFDRPDHHIAKEDLLKSVWGYGDNIETHTLETHIYRLRQKIEQDPSVPSFLVTTDEGYQLKLS
jgi:DNA-binding response OmpR family regulator